MEGRFVLIGACDLKKRSLYDGRYIKFELSNNNKVKLSLLKKYFGPILTLEETALDAEADGFCKVSFEPGAQVLLESLAPPVGAVQVAIAPASQAPASQAPGTQAPATQAPATQAPATQAPATQAPGTQAPATQAPGTQAPATQAPATQAAGTQAPAIRSFWDALFRFHDEAQRHHLKAD
ncbi:hypothetical protein Vretimale_6764 [Volvox reticuliferus]|uniref:Uncharacterized protein n=1 Tax=Volvox reticuliferus TaxID=1737510 RepID=A0A8J4LMP2_9CHLO|nr:hypothetical protein Vretimale_6764 [Volvox reticuliferus]